MKFYVVSKIIFMKIFINMENRLCFYIYCDKCFSFNFEMFLLILVD